MEENNVSDKPSVSVETLNANTQKQDLMSIITQQNYEYKTLERKHLEFVNYQTNINTSNLNTQRALFQSNQELQTKVNNLYLQNQSLIAEREKLNTKNTTITKENGQLFLKMAIEIESAKSEIHRLKIENQELRKKRYKNNKLEKPSQKKKRVVAQHTQLADSDINFVEDTQTNQTSEQNDSYWQTANILNNQSNKLDLNFITHSEHSDTPALIIEPSIESEDDSLSSEGEDSLDSLSAPASQTTSKPG